MRKNERKLGVSGQGLVRQDRKRFARRSSFFSPFLVALLVMLTACGGGATSFSQQTANYAVQLQLDTLAIGDRTATVTIRDQAGQAVQAEQVTLTPTMLTMGMASPEVQATSNGDGRYTGEKVLLSMTGDWELDVKIQRGSTTETARFTFTVPTQ